MDAALGADTENWVEANVWATVEKTAFSAFMRKLVGLSVCGNGTFREEVIRFTKAYALSSVIVGRTLPKFLRRLLSGLTLIWHITCLINGSLGWSKNASPTC